MFFSSAASWFWYSSIYTPNIIDYSPYRRLNLLQLYNRLSEIHHIALTAVSSSLQLVGHIFDKANYTVHR